MDFGLNINPVGALSGLIQTGMQGRQQRRNIRDQHKYNLDLAKYTYAQDLNMWNRMNEYNAPAAQMQRFKDAGLNPNLIYGRGSSGQANTMPKYQQQSVDFMSRQPMVDMSAIMNGLQGFTDLEIKDKQKRLIEEQITGQQEKNATEALNRFMKIIPYIPSDDTEKYRTSWKTNISHWVGSLSKNLLSQELFRTQEQVKTEKARQYQVEQSGRVSQKTADMFELVKFGALALGAGNLMTGLGRLTRLSKSTPIKGTTSRLLRQIRSVSRSKSGRTRTINTRNIYE